MGMEAWLFITRLIVSTKQLSTIQIEITQGYTNAIMNQILDLILHTKTKKMQNGNWERG